MIKPLRGFVLVELMEDDDKSPSGKLLIPDSAKEKPMKGKVVDAGHPTLEMINQAQKSQSDPYILLQVRKDDIVYFKRYGGDAVKLEGKDYQFVAFEHLLGVEA